MSSEVDKIKKQKRSGLGRGLGSLLGSDLEDTTGGFQEQKLTELKPNPTIRPLQNTNVSVEQKEYLHLPIEKLIPNKEQPRKTFSAEELAELSASIKEKGIIQPILVKKTGQDYQIIAGERRWRAAQIAGLQTVPALVKDVNSQEVLELALIENIQRHDLNPIEEAEAYYALAEKYKLTQKEISEKVGKDRATVANSLRILGLAKDVREMVKRGDLQLGHAKVLLGITELDVQKKLAAKASKDSLSVRALEKLIKKTKSEANSSDKIDIELDSVEPTLLKELALELQKTLGTRVQIQFNGKSGKVEIAFYSISELNQLAERILK